MQTESCVDVSLGAAEEGDVVVRRMNKADARHLDNRRLHGGTGCHDLITEVQDLISCDIDEEVRRMQKENGGVCDPSLVFKTGS